MDKRVVEWADGDLSKVNMHEPARGRLEARGGALALLLSGLAHVSPCLNLFCYLDYGAR